MQRGESLYEKHKNVENSNVLPFRGRLPALKIVIESLRFFKYIMNLLVSWAPEPYLGVFVGLILGDNRLLICRFLRGRPTIYE